MRQNTESGKYFTKTLKGNGVIWQKNLLRIKKRGNLRQGTKENTSILQVLANTGSMLYINHNYRTAVGSTRTG